MSKEMTVEQMAYTLGELHVGKHSGSKRVDALVSDLRARGVLFEDNLMGNGWKVVELDGNVVMPSCAGDNVWSSKGYAWAFWTGMGAPTGMRLCCVSWPEVETDAVRVGNQKGFEGVKGHAQLRAVK